MKLNMLWEFKVNELELHFLLSTLIGLVMFLIGVTWDMIVGVRVHHSQGIGLYQWIWIASWGLYSLWSFLMAMKWGDK